MGASSLLLVRQASASPVSWRNSADTASDEILFWIEGQALSYGQKMSYWPFKEILWHFVGIEDDDSELEVWEKFEQKNH